MIRKEKIQQMIDDSIKAFAESEKKDFEAAVAEDDQGGGTPDTSSAHGIWLSEYAVLVKPDEVEEKIGSIFIPDEHKERLQYASTSGWLVEVSPVAFSYEVWPEGARLPQVGDHVIFPKYAGTDVEGKDGVNYRLLSDKDIKGGYA